MTVIDTQDLNGRELVAELHPLSEISRDHTRKASDEIAELVRYLNHVTYNDEALPYPIDSDSLVSNIGAALDMLPQLMEQLGGRLTRLTNRPDLSTDDTSDPAARVSVAVAALERVRANLGPAASAMRDVRRQTSHLNLKG